jgi:hypothetical protein
MIKKFQTAGYILLGLWLVGLIVFFIWQYSPQGLEFHVFALNFWSIFKPFIFFWILEFFLPLSLALVFIPKIASRKSNLSVNIKSKELDRVIEILESDPQAAISSAFTILEDRLRKMTGCTENKANMNTVTNKAFGDGGLYTYKGDPSEDIGIKNLLQGAFTVFRNPNSHQVNNIDLSNAISVLALIDFLLIKINQSKHK